MSAYTTLDTHSNQAALMHLSMLAESHGMEYDIAGTLMICDIGAIGTDAIGQEMLANLKRYAIALGKHELNEEGNYSPTDRRQAVGLVIAGNGLMIVTMMCEGKKVATVVGIDVPSLSAPEVLIDALAQTRREIWMTRALVEIEAEAV